MTEAGDKPRRRRWWKYLVALGIAGLLLLAGVVWYANTQSFQRMVRGRLVTELERITGGRVEVGSFHAVPFRFRVEVRDVTIHGLEQPTEIPYAHVDSLTAKIKIISVLGAEFGFSSLQLDGPVVHIITCPDGSTNQPRPRLQNEAGKTTEQKLFSLTIRHLEVRRGEFIWNQQKTPFDFVGNDIAAEMTYSLLRRQYAGDLSLGKVDTMLRQFRPVSWTANAHFVLSSDRVEVKSFQASAGRSRLSAAGVISSLKDPKFEGQYELSLDLGEAFAVARRSEVTRGVLLASGRGKWSLEDFQSAGKISVSDLDWRDRNATLRNASGMAEFSIDPKRLNISHAVLRGLGGSAVGELNVVNWLSPNAASGTKTRKSDQQSGTFQLKLSRISLAELANGLAKPKRPLNALGLSGSIDGTVDGRWSGAPGNMQSTLALDVSPPQRLPAGQMPLTARLRAVYDMRSDQLDVSELSASTRATQIRASGTLASRARLAVSVSTTGLEEWRPLLGVLGVQQQLPITLHGEGSFAGNATGTLSNFALAGHLQIQDWDSLLPAREYAAAREIHWDSLVSDVQVSRSNFSARNGTMRHGATVIGFDVSGTLDDGQFTPENTFTARVGIRGAELGELQSFAGVDYPVSGTLNLYLHAGGTRAEPNGEGHLELTQASAYGHAFENLTSDVRFRGTEVELNNIHLQQQQGALISGGIAFDSASRVYHFNLTGKNFDLTRIPQLEASRVKVEGRLDFDAQGSGTVEAPVISANLHVRDLTLDHERAGDFFVVAATQGADLKMTGRSQFEHSELSLAGDVQMRGDWPAKVNLHFNHFDIDSLLRTYLHGEVTGHSAVAGDVDLSGPLRQPGAIKVAGHVSDFFAEVEHVKVRNDGPVSFLVSDGKLDLQQFRLTGEGTDLAASGTVQLSGERQINMHAQGKVDLHLIETFNPDFTSSGLVTLDVAVAGTAAKPQMEGKLQISNGSIAYIDLPSALSELNGTLVFNQDRLQIESLSGRTGGGLITAQGYASAYSRKINFDLKLHGQDVRLRYPPGVSSTATADVHWTGSNSASTLSGDVTITKLAITPGFDFGAYLARAAQTSSLPQTNPLLNRIRLDVHITTVPELQMQTAVVRLSGDADMRLRGTAAKPVIVGRADILEGEIYFNGTKYRLERGDVSFVNPITTTPQLDLQASTRVRDYDITISLNGQPDKLHVSYRSEPPLPESDIIALLALGRTQEESAQLQQSGQSAFSQEASNAILTEALNATVSSRVQRLFGGSRIKIDPQGLSTETSPVRGPQVTIEQQVANNWTLTYSTNVSEASQQIIQVEYNVSRNVSVVAIRDQNGVVSFDIRIRRRKK
jgi:translocation and assembly module TamB